MADAAAARREARRRRILENSHDRLQRIAGTKSPNIGLEVSQGETPWETPLPDSVPTEVTTSTCPQLPLNGSAPHVPLLEGISHNAPQIANILQNLASNQPTAKEETVPHTMWEKLSITKLDIILISVFIQITYNVLWTSKTSPNIFLPLILYQVTRMLMCQKRRNSGMVSTMLLMNGVAPERVQSIMSVAQLILTFLEDVCVYLFFTVFVQSIYSLFFKRQPLGTN